MHTKRILVLYGGWNRERDVSLMSTPHIIDALKNKGYTVDSYDLTRNLTDFISAVHHFKPDVVFNNIYGRWGEDGCIQGVLEILKVPYTHSGVMASSVAMYKPLAQRLFRDNGVQVADHVVLTTQKPWPNEAPLPFPFIVKPCNDGSSVAVAIIKDIKNFHHYLSTSKDATVMAEVFIPGRELSIAVMGGKAMGVLELCPKNEFYDYEAKYTAGKTEYLCPAPIDKDIWRHACQLSEKAFAAIGCQGVARVDIRFNPDLGVDGLFVLEINTQPGLTPLSIVPKILATQGYTFGDSLAWMIENARCPE